MGKLIIALSGVCAELVGLAVALGRQDHLRLLGKSLSGLCTADGLGEGRSCEDLADEFQASI